MHHVVARTNVFGKLVTFEEEKFTNNSGNFRKMNKTTIYIRSVSRRCQKKPDCGKTCTASRSYLLKDECGSDQTVCKTMFLATFGYKSDKVISNLFLCNTPTKIKPIQDRCGKHSPKHKMTEEVKDLISSHISKFNPCINHY